MRHKGRFLLLGTGAVFLQGYFLTALIPAVAPSLLAIMLLASSERYSLSTTLLVAVWLGLILDTISLHTFGVYMLMSVGMATIIYWINSRGLAKGSFLNVAIILAVALIWQGLVLALVGYFPALAAGAINGVAVVIGQAIGTIAFAWPIRRLVQLEV